MRVSELTERLGVPYRHVRYILEQGILPTGVDESPGRGEHRELIPAQAFWLAIVLSLKQNGIKAPLAGKIADFAQAGVRGVAANENWDWRFNPFLGRFDTDFQWFVDIGDLCYVRIATTANPSHEGLYAFPWSIIGKRKTDEAAAPIVTIRLDITRLAERLREL